jgi:hypothetical protein
MEQVVQPQSANTKTPSYREAWDMVTGRLRSEMPRAQFETWVQPLQPLGYRDRVFKLGALNAFNQSWVESRLQNRIASILSGMLNEPVTLKVVVVNSFHKPGAEGGGAEPLASPPADAAEPQPIPGELDEGVLPDEEPIKGGPVSARKLMLQRAYGTQRARIIQPERGMFVTLYFFKNWLPLIGHSAFAVILAARSMCYWNPKTGELRNSIETDMAEIAKRASVSVRTVKDVLNQELVKRYFIRYTVRRMMTPNGVRTAGIQLQVRMDDPLTPEDQAESGQTENEYWYSPEFGGEKEDDSTL